MGALDETIHECRKLQIQQYFDKKILRSIIHLDIMVGVGFLVRGVMPDFVGSGQPFCLNVGFQSGLRAVHSFLDR
jgi:hypothetical protein